MDYLIYINYIGEDWNNNQLYDFIFSNTLENIDGDGWDNYPAAGTPELPNKQLITNVGRVETEIKFDLIQNSHIFAYWDAVDGVVAIGWENTDEYDTYPEKRLFFHFGQDKNEVDSLLIEHEMKITENIMQTV